MSNINSHDLYHNQNFNIITQEERNKIKHKFNQSKDTINTGVVPLSGFNQRIYNSQTNSQDFHPNQESDQHNFFSQLSGQTIQVNNIKQFHNNMEPFFGGSVRQNLTDGATSSIIENHTGNGKTYKHKSELKSMFDMERDMTHTFGSPNVNNDEIKSRYIPSQKRQNELPITQIRVGPGLNQGYTSKPSGGLNQANTREFVMPKDTNELRTLNNPKVSYKSRIVMGQKEPQRGLVVVPQKHKPDTFYKNTPDRWFKTGGQFKAQKIREKVYAKPTRRKNTISHYGGLGATHNAKSYRSSAVRKSRKNNYKNPWTRNLNGNNQWSINNQPVDSQVGDYGKHTIEIKNQERDITQRRQHNTNVKSIVEAIIMPVLDILRETRKENYVGNQRPDGNMNAQIPKKPTIHDPDDVMKTTIKETLIDNNHDGFIGTSMPNKLTVHDPDDVARTTIKETLIDNNHDGFIGTSMPNKPTIQDPDDIARTTIKETNIDNNHEGFIGTSMPSKLTVYDPDDIARTTVKETTIDNSHLGNISVATKLTIYDPEDIPKTTIKETTVENPNPNGFFHFSGPEYTYVRDPDDVIKITIKETTIDNDHTGFIEGAERHGIGSYNITQSRMVPRNTNKQFTSDYYYQGQGDGNVMGGGGKGYLVNKFDAKNTHKQFTSDYEYKGTAKHSTPNSMSYADKYNGRTNPNKEEISKGRNPTKTGVKVAIGRDKINNHIRRIEGDVVNIREPASQRVYEIGPQKNECGMTRSKDKLSEDINRERINPDNLKPLRDNPYAKPLDSIFPY